MTRGQQDPLPTIRLQVRGELEHHPYPRTVEAATHHLAAADRGDVDHHVHCPEDKSHYPALREERGRTGP
jgi:hypothetical protein